MNRFLCLLILVGASVCAFGQTCTTFPCVVASVTLTNQTQPVASTPIFTPTNSGVFRVSAYLTTKGHNKPVDARWVVDVRWTDEFNERIASTGAFYNGDSSETATFVLQSVGEQPVLFRTRSLDRATDHIRYDLFLVVEQLQ